MKETNRKLREEIDSKEVAFDRTLILTPTPTLDAKGTSSAYE